MLRRVSDTQGALPHTAGKKKKKRKQINKRKKEIYNIDSSYCSTLLPYSTHSRWRCPHP
jgi:hypothetical protein